MFWRFVGGIAEELGFASVGYWHGQKFLDRYEPQPGCVVLDGIMPLMGAEETLGEMARRGWRVPVATMSAMLAGREAQRLLDLGAIGHLVKPFRATEMQDWIERAVSIDAWQRRLRRFQPDIAG